MTFVRTDILKPYQREIVSTDSYDTLIKFLLKYYPSGFESPVDISVNGKVIEVSDYDIELQDDDIVVLLDRAAVPAAVFGGSILLTALANLAISVTLSYVVNKLFAPEAPKDTSGGAQVSSVYNLNSAQNTAKYGSPIPIIYGTVRMYPSMIVQPFYRFENNIEYLYHILCVSQGRCTAGSIFIGEDQSTRTGDLQYKVLYQDSFYNIPDKAYGIHITNTLTSPSNMEMLESIESEKYEISADAKSFEVDYYYPNGIYYAETDGLYYYHTSRLTMKIYTLSNGVYTLIKTGTFNTTGASKDPIQKTHSEGVQAYTYPVYVSFTKVDTGINNLLQNKLYVKRVKELYPTENFTQDYGDITLLACKIKATNAVSSAGQVKVNGYFTRQDVSNDLKSVLTDIYTNKTYGGALDATNLDFPSTFETVNCCYEDNMTIFDAMKRPTLAQKYSLFLSGMDMILKKDAPNTITSGMYNEMNILRNSIKVQYLFKEESPSYDGYECSYIDADWIPQKNIYPAYSLRPQPVDLFGVAGDGGEAISQEMAMYLYKQDDYRRKIVTFSTDIQGLVPQYLDKIMVSHSALQWGEAGEVYNRSYNLLSLSDALTDTSSGQTIVFRNIDGSVSDPYDIIINDEYNITVYNMPSWVTENIFYTIQNKDTAREFLVIKVKPNGETVQIDCVNYSPEIYS